MKVDFPHPESAATPITTGVCPSARASKEVELRAEKEAGAKAEAEAAKRATPMNFMID